MTASRARFSIVIPTFQRRERLMDTLNALADVEAPWPIEVIVVVDGSRDGTPEAASASPVPTQVIVQANAGAGAARNRGAWAATGEVLFFLDDDMLADSSVLLAHEARLRTGADAVMGDIPLAEAADDNLLTRGYANWAARRGDRLRVGGRPRVEDLLTGQLSVRKEVFTELGGFDESLTADGRFGGEDTDFLHRLVRSGYRIEFAPEAVTHQHYEVAPLRYLKQWEEAGQTDASLSRRHPGLGAELWTAHAGNSTTARLCRLLGRFPPTAALGAIDQGLSALVNAGRADRVTAWAYLKLRDLHYWRGVHRGGGLNGGAPDVVVLAYHGIDNANDPRTGQYTVRPRDFACHLEALRAAGWRHITADEFLDHMERRRPAKGRSVLLTFDDGYADLLPHAVHTMARLGAVGIVLVVTDRIGGLNEWDIELGSKPRRLLDASELARLVSIGWEVGVHSKTHPYLPSLRLQALHQEVRESRSQLSSLGLRTPRFFAYPYGAHDARVRRAAARAGYRASFALTTTQPRVRRHGRHAIPRIEVTRAMNVEDLLAAMDRPHTDRRRAWQQEIKMCARWLRERW